MSNVTVQEALTAAIELIQCFEAKLTNSQTAHSLPSEKVKRKLRDAISEIEKCEPICYVSNGVIRSILEKNAGLVPIWYEKDLKITTPLYTSPQPREWVGLTDEDIKGLPQPNYDITTAQYVKIIEAKIRELNFAEKG